MREQQTGGSPRWRRWAAAAVAAAAATALVVAAAVHGAPEPGPGPRSPAAGEPRVTPTATPTSAATSETAVPTEPRECVSLRKAAVTQRRALATDRSLSPRRRDRLKTRCTAAYAAMRVAAALRRDALRAARPPQPPPPCPTLAELGLRFDRHHFPAEPGFPDGRDGIAALASNPTWLDLQITGVPVDTDFGPGSVLEFGVVDLPANYRGVIVGWPYAFLLDEHDTDALRLRRWLVADTSGGADCRTMTPDGPVDTPEPDAGGGSGGGSGDSLGAHGITPADVDLLAQVAAVTGYGPGPGVPLTRNQADTLAWAMVMRCEDIAAGRSSWRDAVATDVADGAPHADAAEMNDFLRSVWCP